MAGRRTLGSALLLGLGLGACSGSPPVPLAPPAGPDTPACVRLAGALPDDLQGRDRRDTVPASDRTAAWGVPPLRLRCGVARPGALAPTSEVIEVDGVEWFLSERPSGYVFTTVGRRAYVELRVPASVPREQATAPLVGLAVAVRSSVPRR